MSCPICFVCKTGGGDSRIPAAYEGDIAVSVIPPEVEEWPHRITKGMRVLDLGCGSNPSAHATVYCDRWWRGVAERTEHDRETFDPAAYDRPFVAADAMALPFRDGAFDFVICKHLLEHLENPLAACDEIARVGVAGYIECPSTAADALFGAPIHLWLVRKEGDTLVFTRRAEQPFWRANPQGFRGRGFAEQTSLRRALDVAGLWRVSLIWRGSIAARMEN